MIVAALFRSGGRRLVLWAAVLLLSLFHLAVGAQSVEKIFEDGNAFYERGEYEKAARKYEKLLDYGIESPLVYYNLGNTAFKRNELGLAILYYEKGMKRDPKDKDLRENLLFARSLTKDKIEEEGAAFPARAAMFVADSLSFGGWMAVVLVFYLAAAATVFIYITSRRYLLKRLCVYLGSLFLFLFLLSASAAAFHHHRLNVEEKAVVLADELDVKSSPAQDSKILFSVHEGLKVEVGEKAGEWLHIVLPNGLHGWVKREAVGII